MRAHFLSQCLQAMIAGKMTPALQLTDTDVAAVMKRASEVKKRDMMSESRERAQARGEKSPATSCSKVDMLRFCLAGHETVEELNAETNYLLAGVRRNGFLRCKPYVKNRRLVRADEAYPKMKKGMHERSPRIPESWWMRRDGAVLEGAPT